MAHECGGRIVIKAINIGFAKIYHGIERIGTKKKNKLKKIHWADIRLWNLETECFSLSSISNEETYKTALKTKRKRIVFQLKMFKQNRFMDKFIFTWNKLDFLHAQWICHHLKWNQIFRALKTDLVWLFVNSFQNTIEWCFMAKMFCLNAHLIWFRNRCVF